MNPFKHILYVTAAQGGSEASLGILPEVGRFAVLTGVGVLSDWIPLADWA